MDLRVAAYAVITDDHHRLLLPHWHEYGKGHGWTLPGGGIDPGEDPADAVVREVEEETGYRIGAPELLGIDNMVIPRNKRLEGRRSADLHAIRIIYRGTIIGGDLRVETHGSTNDVAWFTPAEVDELQRVSQVDIGRKFAGLIDP